MSVCKLQSKRGKDMLFNRNIAPSCSYCCYSEALGYDEYACSKRGIMSGFGFCGTFKYEPTKRVPQSQPSFKASEFSEKDFTL